MWKVQNCNLDLEGKGLFVTFRDDETRATVQVAIQNFDPTGDVAESQLRTQAIARAHAALRELLTDAT